MIELSLMHRGGNIPKEKIKLHSYTRGRQNNKSSLKNSYKTEKKTQKADFLQNERYLSIPAFSPGVHLAVVFGVVVIERRLAVAEPDHAAVVWVLVPVVTEELPAINVSAKITREKHSFQHRFSL